MQVGGLALKLVFLASIFGSIKPFFPCLTWGGRGRGAPLLGEQGFGVSAGAAARVGEGLKWRGSLGEGGEALSLGMVSLRCSWGDVQEALHWTHDSEDQGERSASGTFWNSPACVVTATDVLIG